jgi:Zn-finger nucleic acid-binding protein
MRCPACEKPLVAVEIDQVEIDACASCEGLWFDADELVLLFEKTVQVAEVRSLQRELSSLPADRAAPRRRCPRCRAWMRGVRIGTQGEPVLIDLCPHADGLWFDRAELPRMLAARLPAGSPGLEVVKKFLGAFASPRSG